MKLNNLVGIFKTDNGKVYLWQKDYEGNYEYTLNMGKKNFNIDGYGVENARHYIENTFFGNWQV